MTTLQNANQPQSTPTAMISNTITAKQTADQIFDSSSSFPTLGLHPILCEELQKRMGIQVPTLVQAEAIPVILSGRHVLVKAATGTGKTITYVAPIIHLLKSCDPPIQRSDGTFALVLVPTRELCMQVYEILRNLLYRFHGIIPGYIMGGENRSKEKARLRKGISILVATPGRLLDHLKNTSSFTHNNLRCIIFDEADRILELGFGKEIEDILEILGSRKNELISENNAVSRFPELKRQNLLLSATLNDKVNHLAKISLENPVMIGLSDNKIQPFPPKNRELMKIATDTKSEVLGEMVCSSTGGYKLPAQLIQRYVKVSCGSRLVVLLSILKNLFNNKASQKIAVFFSTCDAVDFHYSLLSKFQWPPILQPEAEHKQMFLKCKTFRLHGNMKQEDRRSTFMNFKTEQLALLLCTDVAARGLDFPKVRCIIQYDSPGEATEYVHRVGRTARLGERGDSLLFLQPVELDYLKDLEKHGVSVTEYPILKELDSFALHDQKHQFKKVISLELHPWVLSLQKALETFVLAEPKMKELAKEAFCSWTRAYTAHRGDLKKIFTVKKLHLGHVAKSFALKEQPALVGQSFRKQQKKRKRDEKQKGISRRKKTSLK